MLGTVEIVRWANQALKVRCFISSSFAETRRRIFSTSWASYAARGRIFAGVTLDYTFIWHADWVGRKDEIVELRIACTFWRIDSIVRTNCAVVCIALALLALRGAVCTKNNSCSGWKSIDKLIEKKMEYFCTILGVFFYLCICKKSLDIENYECNCSRVLQLLDIDTQCKIHI